MKIIFDFDDVLFNNTKQFKPHMYACLEEAGVSQNFAEKYYKEVREKEFSLKDFITYLFHHQKITDTAVEDVYKKIMNECKNFINIELIELVKKIGKSNCYIITNGEKEFNYDKVYGSGVAPLFNKIYIVPGSKKSILENICRKNKNEKVIFIDDKNKFLDDIDFKKCQNLKTILYDENGLEKLKAEISEER